MKAAITKAMVLIGAPLFFIKIATAQSSLPLNEFDKIKADANVKIELMIADRHSAYNESGKQINASVENGTLNISASAAGNETIKIYTRSIRSIILDGAATLTCKDTIKNDLLVDMDGAAKSALIVSATQVNVKLDGAAKLELGGNAQTLSANLDGAAKLDAEAFSATQVNVETDGAASATVHPDSTLKGKSDGMSSIRYLGDPANKSLSVDGLSSIKGITSGDVFDDKAIEGIASGPGDTTRLKFGNKKFLIIGDDEKKKDEKRRMKRVYAGFEMGVNGFATPDLTKFSSPYKGLNGQIGKSWFFGLNLFELNGHIIKNKLALTTGLGMQWSNYRFDGDDYLAANVDSLGFVSSPDALSKNKLYTFDLNAPFMIKFAPGSKTRANGGFHIAAGAIVRYITTAQVITETSARGFDQRVEFRDDFNINPFKVDGTVRIGYDKVKLFFNYGLTPYFSKSPDVRTFAAGITVIGF